MSELPKPPESQPPTSSDDWEDKKTPHTNRPVPKSWKWMLAISLVLTVCSSGVAVITYLDNRELARELASRELARELASKETLITLRGTDDGWFFASEKWPSVTELQSKVTELEQQLALVESSLKEQQLQSAKTSLDDATKSTQEIERQLLLLAEKERTGKVLWIDGMAKSLSSSFADLWTREYESRISACPK